jgi:hypothetical protein
MQYRAAAMHGSQCHIGGYYGYALNDKHSAADFDIWCHENPPAKNSDRDMETVEAEVVFLIRRAGRWPLFQTEIHFHPSMPHHRKIAETIIAHYG